MCVGGLWKDHFLIGWDSGDECLKDLGFKGIGEGTCLGSRSGMDWFTEACNDI